MLNEYACACASACNALRMAAQHRATAHPVLRAPWQTANSAAQTTSGSRRPAGDGRGNSAFTGARACAYITLSRVKVE